MPRPAALSSLAALLTGPDGRPVPVERVVLTAAQRSMLCPCDGASPMVFVPDPDALAALVRGATAGVVVTAEAGLAGDDGAGPPPGGAVALVARTDVGEGHRRVLEAFAAGTAAVQHTVDVLRAEAAVIDALNSVGRRLTAQLDLDRVVQDATDAATTAVGAAFGAFFYNLVDQFGESYTLYTLSGAPREAFERFPMPRNTAVFAPTFDGEGTVRSPDITVDPRFGRNAPYHGMPEGHLPVRSYLAVPVISPTSGEVLGGFFFGHPEPGRFTDRHEYLAEGIAGYSAIALDNSRLFERERNLARELSRSMLPEAPPVAGLEIVTRYLPAATGSKIGGDWFDVIPLPGDATAFVIGDVVGHGVTAATVMGQARTAVRCYAVLGLPPSRVLHQTSAVLSAFTASTFVTCFYAVHSADGTLRYANAGHLPALLRHVDGTLTEFGEALGQPLGVGASFPERTIRFGIGDELLLYTDGLVESRTRDLTVGMGWLRSAVAALPRPVTAELCDGLVAELTGGAHDDDVALIHVRNTGRGVA